VELPAGQGTHTLTLVAPVMALDVPEGQSLHPD
jgi:hypothetical protein